MSISSEAVDESTDETLIPAATKAPNVDTDEKELFANEAILFIFNREKNEWISRGSGELKILQNNDGYYRILMRQDRTFVVRVNHQIPYLGTLHTIKGSNVEFSWTAFDFADTKEPDNRQLFAVHFANKEIAASFKTAFETGQSSNKKLMEP